MIFCENTIGTIQQIKDDLDCRQYSCKIKEKANKFIQTEVKKKVIIIYIILFIVIILKIIS